MKKAHKERLLAFSPRQLFDLVEDVQSYPEFLPWCVAARIKNRGENYQLAELMIGFKMLKERFTSHVTSDPESLVIRSEAASGPFKQLTNVWTFLPDPQGREDHCLVRLHIEFEFSNKILQRVIEAVFEEAQVQMVNAFEQRAKALYGVSGSGPGASAATRAASSVAAS